MARILMVNVPYAGHTNPTLPLTRKLVARGHRSHTLTLRNGRKGLKRPELCLSLTWIIRKGCLKGKR